MARRFIIVYDIRTIGMVCAMMRHNFRRGMEIGRDGDMFNPAKERGAVGCPAFMRTM